MREILFIYVLTFGIKLSAFYYSGFTAILADAFHSVVDILMILILIASERYARKDADLTHPFGHGMAKNVASLVVGVGFITFLSFELFREGIFKILNPGFDYRNTEIAIGAEATVLFLLIIAAIISARRTGILNRTLLVESLNDSLSTVAAILGVALVWIGYAIFDGIATLFIASIIFYNSYRLVRDNARILIGMSPSEEFYKSVEEACFEIDRVRGVHDMVGVYTGEDSVHLDLHVTVDGKMTIEEADELSVEIAEALMNRHPEIKHVSIHFCPHDGEKRRIYRNKGIKE
jgi:cation diffusion facilitator family transporter